MPKLIKDITNNKRFTQSVFYRDGTIYFRVHCNMRIGAKIHIEYLCLNIFEEC